MTAKENKKETTELTEVSQETALVSIDANALDLAALQGDAGHGTENMRSTDLATPIISILQSNSPQVKRSDGKYIEGAKEGDFFNNVTMEVYPGDKGIMVVPAYFEKVHIEWKPDRGGFVAMHGVDTELKDQVVAFVTPEGKTINRLPNGNSLVETNQYISLLVKDDGSFTPVVLSFTSSALKASKTWNTLINSVKMKGKDGKLFNPPSYSGIYKMTAVARTKDSYSWFGWAVERLGYVNPDLYNVARELNQIAMKGGVRAKHDVDTAEGDASVPKEAEIDINNAA